MTIFTSYTASYNAHLPSTLTSSRVSGILSSAVSGRMRPGTEPRAQRMEVIRNGASSERTDWKEVSLIKFSKDSPSY